VSWKSSKQDTVADSTMKAVYIATSEVAKKLFGSEILFPSWISIVIIVEP
jgi:hypothetical protein